MKILFCCLLLLTTVSQAAVPEVLVWDGTPHVTEVQLFHVSGVPMMARLIQINSHLMGCQLMQGGCSVGPPLSFWIQTGIQEENCYEWFSEIREMETTYPNARPYPYLELVIGPGNIWTDEGIWVYPAGSVRCNGALDWTS